MKVILISFIIFFVSLSFVKVIANNRQEKNDMTIKVKLTFNNQEVIIKFYNNSVSKQILNLLPATFKFRDFAGQEKVTDFKNPLLLNEVPRGMVASAGKVFIYAPWGNMGIFYKDAGDKIDKNLIPLGEVESGLELLFLHKDDFEAKLEIINNDNF